MSRGAEGSGADGPGTTLLGLAAARVLLPVGPPRAAVVWIDTATGTITRVDEGGGGAFEEARLATFVDLGDRLLSPGFVDVHVHGAAGKQVNGEDADDVAEAVAGTAAFHARHGTTSIVATTVSDSHERLVASVGGIARAARELRASRASSGSRVLGSHLEGPFISASRAGAQDPAQIRPPDRSELARLFQAGDGTVRMVTLAPETHGARELIADCLDAGVVASLGHSDADFDCARASFDAGATHVVHLFDAMGPFHHRAPGVVGAALSDEVATVEVICDPHHLHPSTVALVCAAAPHRTVFVTDATAAAGLPPGPFSLGRLDVVLEGTRVTLASDPSTLAGSALTMDHAVRRAVRTSHIPLEQALRSASTVPAGVVTRGGRELEGLGAIAHAAPADLVVLDDELDVVATLVAGTAVFDPGSIIA